jgi:hypothetical protein
VLAVGNTSAEPHGHRGADQFATEQRQDVVGSVGPEHGGRHDPGHKPSPYRALSGENIGKLNAFRHAPQIAQPPGSAGGQ